MKNTDYAIAFPTDPKDPKEFMMDWYEGGRRYRLYFNEDARSWRIIRQRGKGTLYETVEEYASLWWALQGISCYTGPCEEETMELYGLIRQTLAATDLEEIEIK